MVFYVVKVTLPEFQRAHVIYVRFVSVYWKRKNPIFILHVGLLPDFGSNVRNLREICREDLNIFLGETYWNSGLLSASLHGSLPRDNDDELSAEICEDIGAGLTEAIAIGEKHDNGRDAPRHAQHGERGAAAVVTHRGIGFLEEVPKHPALLLAQRFHGLHHGGFTRRIEACDDSGECATCNREERRHRPNLRRTESPRALNATTQLHETAD